MWGGVFKWPWYSMPRVLLRDAPYLCLCRGRVIDESAVKNSLRKINIVQSNGLQAATCSKLQDDLIYKLHLCCKYYETGGPVILVFQSVVQVG